MRLLHRYSKTDRLAAIRPAKAAIQSGQQQHQQQVAGLAASMVGYALCRHDCQSTLT